MGYLCQLLQWPLVFEVCVAIFDATNTTTRTQTGDDDPQPFTIWKKMQVGCSSSMNRMGAPNSPQEEAADHRQMSSGDRDHPCTLSTGRLGGFLDRKDPEYTITNGNSQELEFEGAEVSPWISWKTFKQGLNLS